MNRLLLPALLALATCVCAQTPARIDPQIQAIVDRVDAERIEAIVRKLCTFGTRHTLSATESETRGIGAARRWLHAAMKELAPADHPRWSVAFESHMVERQRRIPRPVEVVNVVGHLKGKDPDRWIIVSGHYDSRATQPNDATSDAPGANDDASGVAAMMEAARVMMDLEPRANVLFIAFAGEEQGLLGSAGHARMARAEGRRVEAMITNDIVGGVRGSSGLREPMRIRVFSEGIPTGPVDANGRVTRGVSGSDNDASSRQLARYMKERGEAYVPGWEVTLIFRQDRYLRGGDHKPFNREGFPGVRVTECHENYDWQHQDVRTKDGQLLGDLPDNVDYAYVGRVTRMNVATLVELALAPAAPRGVRVMVDQLTPHTELRWSQSDEEDLAGYTIVMRRTHEPFWSRRVEVDDPKQTSIILERFSKDDWLFGVQAKDRAGRRSLPVYPRPSYGRRRR